MDNSEIKSTLALIQRSPDRGDGWRSVSEGCWPLLDGIPSELIEVEPDGNAGRVRMTDAGRAVLTFA